MDIEVVFAFEGIREVLQCGDFEIRLQDGWEVRQVFHIGADHAPSDTDFLALMNDGGHGADDRNFDFRDAGEIEQELAVAGVDEVGDFRAGLAGEVDRADFGKIRRDRDDLDIALGAVENRCDIEFHRAGDAVWDFGCIERLGDATREAGVLGVILFEGGGLEAQAEERDVLERRVGTRGGKKFQTGLVREGEADEDDVGSVLGGDVRCDMALGRIGAGGADDFPTALGDSFLDRIEDGRVLIHHKYLDRVGDHTGLLVCYGSGRGCGWSRCAGFGFECHDAAHAVDHSAFGEWLHDVVAHAHFCDLEHILFAGLGGEHDDRDVFQRGSRLEFRKAFDSIHDGHRDIKQDDIGLLALGGLETLGAIAGEDHLNIVRSEGFVDEGVDHSAVIHAKNFGLAHG